MLRFHITIVALCAAYRDHGKAPLSEHRAYLARLSAALVAFHTVHELDILLDNLPCRAQNQKVTLQFER
jgi:hypothetical protein